MPLLGGSRWGLWLVVGGSCVCGGDVQFGVACSRDYYYGICICDLYMYIYIYRVVSLFTVSALLKLPFGPPYSCNDFYRTDEILDRESLQNDMDRKDRS